MTSDTKLVFHSIKVVCLLSCLLPLFGRATGHYQEENLFKVMADLVVPFGYPIEEHFVTTEDGYILRNFRIPAGHVSATVPSSQSQQAAPASSRRSLHAEQLPMQASVRPVAVLQHALLDSSVDYVFQGPNSSLAFMLADQGYDVWLTNVRGNRFSRNHTSLDPEKDAAFWQFSWDEMAARDLPAVLAYVIAATGADQVAYVGYSQGTTMAFAALSSQPELSRSVAVAALMAPVALLKHVTSTLLVTSAMMDTDKLYDLLGIMEFFPHSDLQSAAMVAACRAEPAVCISWLAMMGGTDPANVDREKLPQFFRYFPAGTSVQNMAHWCQSIRQCGSPSYMARYDYGQRCSEPSGLPRRCNQDMYGQRTPPHYNLSAITTPLALFTGGQDSLADPRDISDLLQALEPHTVVLHHHEPAYNHWDFGVGMDAHTRVYPLLIEELDRHMMKPAAATFPPQAAS